MQGPANNMADLVWEVSDTIASMVTHICLFFVEAQFASCASYLIVALSYFHSVEVACLRLRAFLQLVNAILCGSRANEVEVEYAITAGQAYT